jgi:hypothetical protein
MYFAMLPIVINKSNIWEWIAGNDLLPGTDCYGDMTQ